MQTFSTTFQAAVERDARQLIDIALRLVCTPSSPYVIDASILDSYTVKLDWDARNKISQGGTVAGNAYIELALYGALGKGNVNNGFSYGEGESEGVGFRDLVDRPYIEVLACLISHEVAHAAIFFAAAREPSFGYPPDHCQAWATMYRYLRSNLMFMVAHESVRELRHWEELVNPILLELPAILDDVNDHAERTYENEGIDVEYGVVGGVELFVEECLLKQDRDADLIALSTLSIERLQETYLP